MAHQLNREQQDQLIERVFDGGLRPPSTFFFPPPRPRGRVRIPGLAETVAVTGPQAIISTGPRARVFTFHELSLTGNKQITFATGAIQGPFLIDYVMADAISSGAISNRGFQVRVSPDNNLPAAEETEGDFVGGTIVHDTMLSGGAATANLQMFEHDATTNTKQSIYYALGILVTDLVAYVKITWRIDGVAAKRVWGHIRVIEGWDPAWQVGG